jgi:hypothetical protein
MGTPAKKVGSRSLIDTGEADLAISESNFSANSKPYAKRLEPMNQGPGGEGGWLMKKTRVKNLMTLSL